MMRALLIVCCTLPSVAAEPITRKDLKLGLVGTFASDAAVRTRLEPGVALLLAPGESAHPDLTATRTARWEGYLQIVTPGEYQFSAHAQNATVKVVLARDAGVTTVLEGVAAKAEERLNGPMVRLDAGFHRFTADARFQPGHRRFELLWKGPGFLTEPIPYFFFGHRAADRGEQYEVDLARDHGRLLFEELACGKCHRADKPLTERSGPDLTAVASRAYARWLDTWLADPAKLRPQTAMPKMFTDDARGVAERHAVVRYLLSLSPPLSEPVQPAAPANDQDGEQARSQENGRRLFMLTGCAACHGEQLAGTMKLSDDDDPPPPPDPRDAIYGFGTATGPQALYTLGSLGEKTTAEQLAKFLLNPLATHPHGRMPSMGLSQAEALDLARHLTRSTDGATRSTDGAIRNTDGATRSTDGATRDKDAATRGRDAAWTDRTKLEPPAWDPIRLADTWLDDPALVELAEQPVQEQWINLGRRLFISKGCANCHVVHEGDRRLPVAPFASLSEIAHKSDTGCLADQPQRIVYSLDDRQRQALRTFIQQSPGGAAAPIDQARAAMKRFNCLNCHALHGEGGLGNALADVMKALENAQNAEDVTPPRLTGIGHKATTAWLRGVLLEGGRARPWMGMRMPQYGSDKVGFLPRALAACDGLPTDQALQPKLDPDEIEAGRRLTGKEGLGCVACHDMAGFPGGGTRGPDLAQTTRRVREEWFIRWMHNPQRLAPGTRMPQNFTNGRSVSNLLDGDADAQTRALWSYLSVGPNLPLPTGLEPPGRGIPLVVKERVEVWRTFLPGGAGPKPVAVGFPGGVSYAYDSHACRLAFAWEGNFLDVGPVWLGRGGNAAQVLGPRFFTPPPGQPWQLGESPKFAERAGDYAFGALVPFHKIYPGPMRVRSYGYSLDDRGVPTWEYEVQDADGSAAIRIRERTEPAPAGVAVGLQRRFEVNAARLNGLGVWFHAADLAADLAGRGSAAADVTGQAAGQTARQADGQADNPAAGRGTGRGTGPARLLAPAAKAAQPLDLQQDLPVTSGMLILPQSDGRAWALVVTEAPTGTQWRFPEEGGVRHAAIWLPANQAPPEFALAFRLWVLPRDDDALLPALPQKNP